MKKFFTFAALAGAALALTACGPEKAAEAPEAAATAEEPMAEATDEAAASTDEAAAAAEGLDPTGNPIGLDKPAGADAMSAEGEAPAAE